MATRSRTLLFQQYRSTFKISIKQTRISLDDESDGLLAKQSHQFSAIPMNNLPPRWVDIMDEINSDFALISDDITKLTVLHNKHALAFEGSNAEEESSIRMLSDKITHLFQQNGARIKRIQNDQSLQHQQLARNIQISLATKMQDLNGVFRKTQASYLQKLRGKVPATKNRNILSSDDTAIGADDEELDAVFSDAQLQVISSNERAITDREKGINEIVKSIHGLAAVFKDLQTMVIDQGTILDRIDYNIEQTNVHVETAHGELVKAFKYQNNKFGKICIIVLAVVVAVLLLVVLFKPKRK